MFHPDDVEWAAAAAAPSWDSPVIVDRISRELDSAWAVEQAKMAREAEAAAREAARIRATELRNAERRREIAPVNKFLREHNMSIVHEKKDLIAPDPLAAANPLSLQFEGRKHRARQPHSPPSSSPPPAAVQAKAAEMGVGILAPLKERLAQKQGAAAPPAVQNAVAAVNQLSAAERQQLLQQLLQQQQQASHTTQSPQQQPVAQQNPAPQAKPRGDAAAQKELYEKMLPGINSRRAAIKRGPLTSAGRKAFLEQCQYHINDAAGEQGFARTGLQNPWWDPFVTDRKKHPSKDELAQAGQTDPDATDSD